MTSGVKICLDKQILGECTKGEDCPICNDNDNIINNFENISLNVELNLNKNAKGYIPKSKRVENSQEVQDIKIITDNKLNLNLNAKEYLPKFLNNDDYKLDENMEEDMMPEDEGEEFDMIMKDILDNEVLEQMDEDDEGDEDRWFPKYKDCECCKGFVYKCKGIACENMQTCYCKVKDECDEENNNII